MLTRTRLARYEGYSGRWWCCWSRSSGPRLPLRWVRRGRPLSGAMRGRLPDGQRLERLGPQPYRALNRLVAHRDHRRLHLQRRRKRTMLAVNTWLGYQITADQRSYPKSF
ncbi:MAG: hypothetical protein QOE61_2873 [Micromonosporaceae bacterium]|nr:hypothetical protein [Micromonosporaceae bacterium]